MEMFPITSPPETFLLTEIADKITIIKIPAISSTIRVPATSSVNFCPLSFSSSITRTMIVGELMESIPPRNMLSITPKPSSLPAANPTASIPHTSTMAVIMDVLPTFASLWKLNSSPWWNMRNMMPISLHVSMLLTSETDGRTGKKGPSIKPASMYPSTSG